MANQEVVLVLDFGSQYNQLIARRIRENKVFSRIVLHNLTAKEIKELNPLRPYIVWWTRLCLRKKCPQTG